MSTQLHQLKHHNRRNIDTENGWARMECTAGDTGHSEDLLMQIRNYSGLLADELPVVNGSSLVAGQFNFSSKYLFRVLQYDHTSTSLA